MAQYPSFLFTLFISSSSSPPLPFPLLLLLPPPLPFPPTPGLILGSLQLPISLSVSDSLGSSSSYCSFLAQLMGPIKLLETRSFIYLSRFKHGISNWWQVLYVGGAVLGGALGAYSSGTIATPGMEEIVFDEIFPLFVYYSNGNSNFLLGLKFTKFTSHI